MSYARQTAVAGAVILGFALNVRAQEPSKDDAPSSKTASPSDPSSKSSRFNQRNGRPSGTRTGGDAAPLSTLVQKDDQKSGTAERPARTESQRHDPIAPDAKVIQFAFATQPWETILEWLSELSGMSLQMRAKPTGTFSYINDPEKYTLGQAIDIINVQLIAKGQILLRKGNYLYVLSLSDGIPPDLIRRIKPEDLDACGDSEYVTLTIPLKNVAAKTAGEEIKAFSSEVGGKIVVQESVNQLMITDLAVNIRMMRDYLGKVEEHGDGYQSKWRVFQLKYASAARVESNLRELFGLPARQTGTQSGSSRGGSDRSSEDPRERFRRMMESGGGNPFMQMFQPGGAGGPGGMPGGDSRGSDRGGDRGDRGDRGGDRGSQESRTNNVTMSVDEPHNQIMVMAPPDKLAIVEEFIKSADVPRAGDPEWTPGKVVAPTVKVIRLSDGDAPSLVTALTQIYQNTPGVRFSADQSNNAVVVVASPDDQEAIKKLAEQFEEDERNSVVLPLSVLDATSVADLLGNVYSSGQTDWRGRTTPRPGQPRVVADRTRNQLMVRGSKKQVDDIRAMLVSLGEPQLNPVAGNDRYRVIPMNPANSRAIRDMIEQVWPSVSPNRNPIRLIDLGKKSNNEESSTIESRRPGASGLERRGDERRPPIDTNGDTPTPPRDRTAPPTGQPGRTSLETRSPFRLVSNVVTDDPLPPPNGTQATGQEQPQDSEAQKGAPLALSFGPDGTIVVASEDPAAVQAVMNLINSVTRGSGNGSEYTVFYLKSADATMLQQQLNDLMGISTTASLFGGSSLGGSTSAPVTPLLKIVPDTRTNSLIVFGNANDVNRVEQLIRVLDRDDAPTSGALSAPRIIALQYANATAVARVVRDVYASRISGGSSGGFPMGLQGSPFGGSPFSPFGGGSPTGRSSRSSSGTISVGVDEQSNSIIVSCSEATYQEIDKLVATLDKAASETQRTVQIVTVKNSTPSAVQDALNGLMGVTTRTTSSGRSGLDPYGRTMTGGYPFGGGNTMGIMPSGGGFPGGFQGNFNPFFNRGGDSGFNRGGDSGFRGGFDGRGGSPFGGGTPFGGGMPFGGGDSGRGRRP